MPSAEAIQKIRSFDLAALRETLAACPPPEGGSIEPLVESATRWVAALCEDIARLLEAIDDPDDCAMTLAIQYVELKSRWIALNTRMNYSMFRTGGCDPADMCRGSAVSALLAHIEPLLDASDIDKITEFLAQPLSGAA